METLLDYIYETKKISYIVAVILMVGAFPFWRFLTEREQGEELMPRNGCLRASRERRWS